MEVANQWRREWAGAAEYGKVTEGGVTRNVARALEVLHASAPGARVRVMRAAWHSSGGPGTPASSYMMHSSRQIISSGSRLLASPSLIQSKPIEISSTPLDVSQEDCTEDVENYEVTEPDDFDISKPSNWRKSTGTSAFRMPSEDSSSTDNNSIIDLTSRNSTLSKNNWRRHSYDSENSENQKPISRVSPLLETPVELSTLKFKSIFNNTSDAWQNRRKSYSFEDTSPLNETIIHKIDTIGMDSSTDSGICRSTEIVDEATNNKIPHENNIDGKEESFKDWLMRNRSNRLHKSVELKAHKLFENAEKQINGNNSLPSVGMVSISLANNANTIYEDDLKRTKRVGFCKTELHFAAESGTVNIIATDEKPPPSNDFRKRRSAFVPIKGSFDKPVTLFGDKFDDLLVINSNATTKSRDIIDVGDENIAATKSILKNKIPKPKPYLLGENMDVGGKNEVVRENNINLKIKTPLLISPINKPIVEEPICIKKTMYECVNKKPSCDNKTEITKNKDFASNDPARDHYMNESKRKDYLNASNMAEKTPNSANESSFTHSLKVLQSSPILQHKSRTRQLKDSDLTYFGVQNDETTAKDHSNIKYINNIKRADDSIFNVVRLVQNVSSKVSKTDESSVADSSSTYQNIPITVDFIPVPTPRHTYNRHQISNASLKEDTSQEHMEYSRRPRFKYDQKTSRSHSEPPKRKHFENVNLNETNKANLTIKDIEDSPVKKLGEFYERTIKQSEHINKNNTQSKIKPRKDVVPLYENIKIDNKTSHKTNRDNTKSNKRSLENSNSKKSNVESIKINNNNNDNKTSMNKHHRKSRSPSIDHYSKNKQTRVSSNTNNDSSIAEIQFANKDALTLNVTNKNKKLNNEHSINKCNKTPKTKENKHGIEHTDNVRKVRNEENIYNTSKKENTEEDKKKRHINDSKIVSVDNSLNSALKKMQQSPISDNLSAQYQKKRNDIKCKEVDLDLKLDKRNRGKEYVLNYDDKNGTFASISKIKSSSKPLDKINTNSSRKKLPDHKKQSKNNERRTLQQSADQHKIRHGWNNEDSRWKSKVSMHRTCELL